MFRSSLLHKHTYCITVKGEKELSFGREVFTLFAFPDCFILHCLHCLVEPRYRHASLRCVKRPVQTQQMPSSLISSCLSSVASTGCVHVESQCSKIARSLLSLLVEVCLSCRPQLTAKTDINKSSCFQSLKQYEPHPHDHLLQKPSKYVELTHAH